jgi:hypothetical protein
MGGLTGVALSRRAGRIDLQREQFVRCRFYFYGGICGMHQRERRVELEMKLKRYKELMQRGWDPETTRRFAAAIAELEQKLREIDE